MKIAATFFGAVLAGGVCLAQTPDPTPKPTLDEAISAFAVQQPDEGSPFFSDREIAKVERRKYATGDVQGATGLNDTAIYPRTDSTSSASTIFGKFFTTMFSSIKIGKLNQAPDPAQLKVEPPTFSMADRREVDVVFSVKNDGKKIMRLDYPTTQRIDIITTDSSGKVLDRWSDDRAFETEEGIVFINPGERIQYSEKVPTRDMKAGEYYEVTADAANNPDYTATRRVLPTP